MLCKIVVLTSLAGLLAGCAFQGGSSIPTAYPADYLPTVIYLTAQSIHATSVVQTAAAIPPTLTSTYTPSPIPPAPTPSDTPTPLPGMSLGAIQFISPGPMSKVLSPVEVRMSVAAGKQTWVQLDLFGEDGSNLYDNGFYVHGPASGQYLFQKIPFEIRAVAEDGILQVTTRDENGVLMALNTVRVLLLSDGISQINPPGNTVYEPITLESPAYESAVSGGVLTVKGTYAPFNLQPLILELIDGNGKSLNANRILTFTNMDSQAINTTIPYNVDSSTQAYLVIHQQDNVLKDQVYLANRQNEVLVGPAYIYTQLITLNP